MKTYGRPGRVFEYQGKEVTVAELSRMSGVPAATIHNRLNYGWSVEAAISAPHKFEIVRVMQRKDNVLLAAE